MQARAWSIRAFLPEADEVDVVVEGAAPVAMERVHEAGFFAARVDASSRPVYKLNVHQRGDSSLREDPYRFRPCCRMTDLRAVRGVGRARSRMCSARGRIEHEGVAGRRSSPSGPRMRGASAWSATSTRGTGGVIRCACAMMRAFGKCSCPGVARGRALQVRDRRPCRAPDAVEGRSRRLRRGASARDGVVLLGPPDPKWSDEEWMTGATRRSAARADVGLRVSLGSWARVPEEGDRYLTYREMAERLVPYVQGLGFTHIELLPITEFPFDGSWGYQPVSLFAPTSRFGTPDDFAYFVDAAHHAGLGVILDWVPAHFPNDAHGLGNFDGTHLYEHADPRQGFHQDWGTLHLQFRPRGGASFLVANARFWLERYHLDGLRVDAVASMLYLDYSRKPGEWVPNRYGGNENLEAIDFLRRMNERRLRRVVPACDHRRGIDRLARRLAARPITGGLGFGFKWNMGWMHDTLRLHRAGADPPRVAPSRADLRPALRVLRKFRPAAVPRRSGPREGLADRQDARRPLAEVRKPARLFRLHVGPSRQEAPVHGRRVRPGAGVEP